MNNIEYLTPRRFTSRALSTERGYNGVGWYFWDEADGQYCYGPYHTKEIAEQKMKEYGEDLSHFFLEKMKTPLTFCEK